MIASQQEPSKVARYYILQGTPAKEQSIPKSVLNGSNDFVSLQAGSKFWVLALSKTNRYENILTKSADAKILKGFGLSNYQEPGLDFDTFIADLKSGKYDSKFHWQADKNPASFGLPLTTKAYISDSQPFLESERFTSI